MAQEMLSRGWHSGPVFGTFAAAAAVGVLLQLNASQFEDAWGMAGTQSTGLTGARFGAMCKRMQHNFAARNGLHAAFFGRCWLHGHQESLRTAAWWLSLCIWRSTFTTSVIDIGWTRRALGDRAEHH
jgi:2-methylcitrate dehydratase PrpD